MKKICFTLFGIFISLSSSISFAYTPTSQDLATISQLKTALDQINSGNVSDIRNFSTQIKEILPTTANDERISYILKELYTYLYGQFSTAKIKTKQTIKSDWITFAQQYDTGIIDISMQDNCFGWYNTLDNISFANNFPTALTIATRYRESHCGYYLPKNGDGPFQILTKDYGTGEISENVFTQSVQDFIDFSKGKYAKYKSKVPIKISYTGTDLNSIISHGALYNGGLISGNIVVPNNPKYVYEGYGTYASGAIRHGLLPKFLKTLKFELNNYY